MEKAASYNSDGWRNTPTTLPLVASHQFLRGARPDNAIVVKANWRDNPWFPTVLEGERHLDLSKFPDRYHHTWEGDYAKAFEGAYFAKVLTEARKQGRVGKVAADPLLPIRLFWDIGGAGAKADACAIWVCQWVHQEIRVLDYIEGQGQVLGLLHERASPSGLWEGDLLLAA